MHDPRARARAKRKTASCWRAAARLHSILRRSRMEDRWLVHLQLVCLLSMQHAQLRIDRTPRIFTVLLYPFFPPDALALLLYPPSFILLFVYLPPFFFYRRLYFVFDACRLSTDPPPSSRTAGLSLLYIIRVGMHRVVWLRFHAVGIIVKAESAPHLRSSLAREHHHTKRILRKAFISRE